MMVDVFTVVTFYTLIQEIKGNNSTITASNTESYPKIVITLCIILFAVIMAVVISKIANRCHDKVVIEDGSSDISENTRKIIRARLSLITLQRKSKNVSIGKKFFRLWSNKANTTLTNNDNLSGEKGTVITVEEAKSKTVQNKNVVSKLTAILSNKISHGLEDIPEKSNTKETVIESKEKKVTKPPPSPSLSSKSSTPRPTSARKQDSFVGPNVSRSDSIPNRSTSAKKRDVTSATAVSINVSGSNKSKKSVTFQDEVKISDETKTFTNSKNDEDSTSSKSVLKSSDTSSANKSNLKKK